MSSAVSASAAAFSAYGNVRITLPVALQTSHTIFMRAGAFGARLLLPVASFEVRLAAFSAFSAAAIWASSAIRAMRCRLDMCPIRSMVVPGGPGRTGTSGGTSHTIDSVTCGRPASPPVRVRTHRRDPHVEEGPGPPLLRSRARAAARARRGPRERALRRGSRPRLAAQRRLLDRGERRRGDVRRRDLAGVADLRPRSRERGDGGGAGAPRALLRGARRARQPRGLAAGRAGARGAPRAARLPADRVLERDGAAAEARGRGAARP